MSGLSKKEILSLIAHQIKAPLGILKWHTEMLLSEDYGELKPEQRAVLEEMGQVNRGIVRLIREFLEISRMPGDNAALELESVSIKSICQNVLRELKQDIRFHDHEIDGNYLDEEYILSADKNILHLVLHTLLSNAIKYTPKQGHISINVENVKDQYVIGIANNGEPISADDQLHIYQQSYRTAHAQAIDPDGTGMGLYLMKLIVEKTGGTSWFTSKKGEDTVFYVAYPLSGMSGK